MMPLLTQRMLRFLKEGILVRCFCGLTIAHPQSLTKIVMLTKKCPFCAETIQKEAILCKHCGRDLPKKEISPQHPSKMHEDPNARHSGKSPQILDLEDNRGVVYGRVQGNIIALHW